MNGANSATSRSWRSSRKAKPVGRSPTCAGRMDHRADNYRWKAKCGGMELSEMQRLKQLEDESPSETHRRRANAGPPGVESGGGKKVVAPIAKRVAVGRW